MLNNIITAKSRFVEERLLQAVDFTEEQGAMESLRLMNYTGYIRFYIYSAFSPFLTYGMIF